METPNMSELSFRKYVLTHSAEDSPAGDFIMDAKHPAAKKMPDFQTWEELESWLSLQGACQGAIDSAEALWHRYKQVKTPVAIELGLGLTVAQLIVQLEKEDPEAHVIKLHENKTAPITRVRGYSKVKIQHLGKDISAIMLE